jgi:hypothetical protein
MDGTARADTLAVANDCMAFSGLAAAAENEEYRMANHVPRAACRVPRAAWKWNSHVTHDQMAELMRPAQNNISKS